jgi:hypothetical protein
LNRLHCRDKPRSLEEHYQPALLRSREAALPLIQDAPQRFLGLPILQVLRDEGQTDQGTPAGLAEGVVKLTHGEQSLLEARPQRVRIFSLP